MKTLREFLRAAAVTGAAGAVAVAGVLSMKADPAVEAEKVARKAIDDFNNLPSTVEYEQTEEFQAYERALWETEETFADVPITTEAGLRVKVRYLAERMRAGDGGDIPVRFVDSIDAYLSTKGGAA